MDLRVRFQRAADLLAQEAFVAKGAFFIPVPQPPPEPLVPLTLVVEGPGGVTAEFAARVVQIAPTGIAVAVDDAKKARELLEPLLVAARAAPADPGAAPTAVTWGRAEAEAASPGGDETAADDAGAEEPGEEPGEEEPATDEAFALREKIRAMSVPEKMALAKHGDRSARLILLKDSVKAVHLFVIQNPRITIEEIIYIAGFRQTNPEVLNMIAASKEWLQNPRVTAALVRNPKTPSTTAVRLLEKLPMSEVRRLARAADVPRAVSQAAKKKALSSTE
ncbi:MAG TPA: hypothetical protein VMV18_13755 [bacterium]|nr:hypothetical protein [bacterium]